MAKSRYIKDSKGATVSVTTDTLGLEKPLLNENYDIDVHNRNMDKIDEDSKPIEDSYIIGLFQHDGDTTNPRDYYTIEEANEKFATKKEFLDVNNEIVNLKQSVSNGKTLIASAITDKEIPTSNTDSFQTMADNIRNIKVGINVTLDGKPLDYDFKLKSEGYTWIKDALSKIPYQFYNSSAVVYNNEIHILGTTSNYANNHYKWDGTSWVSVSTLPCNFNHGGAVVYNNEIHILGSGNSNYANIHYKWDGTSWVSVSTLPYSFYSGDAVVYNNEIHILGGGSSSFQKSHYKWDGTSWVSVSKLPYTLYLGKALVYNNEIHILGSSEGSFQRTHYKWDGTSWVSVSTLPYQFYNSSAVVYNNEIHILGTTFSTSLYNYHYKWDGTSWVSASIIPYYCYSGSAVVYNNKPYILGGGTDPSLTLKFSPVYSIN